MLNVGWMDTMKSNVKVCGGNMEDETDLMPSGADRKIQGSERGRIGCSVTTFSNDSLLLTLTPACR